MRRVLMAAESRRDMAAKFIGAVAVPVLLGATVASARIDYDGYVQPVHYTRKDTGS
jgi:hypothetical protein